MDTVDAVIRDHARHSGRRAVRCGPSREEIDAGVVIWKKRKYIFDGVDNVMKAIARLEKIWGCKLYFYECARSNRRHHLHITRTPQTKDANAHGVYQYKRLEKQRESQS